MLEIGKKEDPLENVNIPKYSLTKSKEINYQEKYTLENALMKYIKYRKGILGIWKLYLYQIFIQTGTIYHK